MKHFRLAAVAGALALSALTHGATAQSTATQPAAASVPGRAPVDLYIGDDTFRSVDISPNGQYVVAIHRETIGDVISVLNLQTHQISRIADARTDQQQKVSFVEFKSDDRLVFSVRQRVRVVANRSSINTQRALAQDSFIDVSRLYSSNIDGTDLKILYDPTAQQGADRTISAGLVSTLPSNPTDVLIITPGYGGIELWRVNVRTGQHTVVENGDVNTGDWVVDSQGTPVLRAQSTANGHGIIWQRRGPGQRNWTEVVRFIGADGVNTAPTFRPLGAATQPGKVFVLARRDGDNTSGLFVYDTATGQYAETLGTSNDFDVTGAVTDDRHNQVLAACWLAERYTCNPIDPTFGRRWNAITHALGDNVNVSVHSIGGSDGSRLILHTWGPQDLGTYYIYDAAAHSLNALFGSRADIDPRMLPTERVVHYTTSDGQQLWGYLWLPPGVTNARNLPTVVVPHGGPESRDLWGDDAFSPYLAAQGYAVFQPNFRGGGGFGRHFVEAGYHQWGQRMQEDVSDGVHYLIQQGVTDAHRICIMGWSYGGYVALTASYQNTDLYKCSVAGAGISDMRAMLRWTRDGDTQQHAADSGGGSGGQSSNYKYWSDAMGSLGTDDAMLTAHSAAENASRVSIPLLLIHGDRDTVVPYEQSQIMQRAMAQAGHPVRLITLPGQDHTPEDVDQFRIVLTESETFIRQNIGPGVSPGSQ